MSPIRPVLVNPKEIRPLPQAMWDVACSKCSRDQARWDVGTKGSLSALVCSPCFLYRSEWAEGKKNDVEALALAIGEEIGTPLSRYDSGELSVESANRVLAAIAMTSRLFEARKKTK